MEKSLKLSLSLVLLTLLICDIDYRSKEERESKAAFKWQEFLDAKG